MRTRTGEYCPEAEARGLTNELFYRNGPKAEPIQCTNADVLLVMETIKRGLEEAYQAGRDE